MAGCPTRSGRRVAASPCRPWGTTWRRSAVGCRSPVACRRTGKDPVGHVLFLKNERPEVYEAAYKFLEPMDFLNMRLTGRFTASYDSIVGHWATDNRGTVECRLRREAPRVDGRRARQAPRPPAHRLGGRPAHAAVVADLGLGEHVQVITGTGDTSSAGIGAGDTPLLRRPSLRRDLLVVVLPRPVQEDRPAEQHHLAPLGDPSATGWRPSRMSPAAGSRPGSSTTCSAEDAVERRRRPTTCSPH